MKSHAVHGLEELTSLKCSYYQKQTIDSIQFLLKYQCIFHGSRTHNSKIYMEPEKTPNSLSNFEKEEQSRRDHTT